MSAENYQLTIELKKTRNELTTLKAIKRFEDSEEVARIKKAYTDLESELVALRQAPPREILPVVAWNEEVNESTLVAQLAESLEREKQKYAALEKKYNELRKELSSSVAYSEPSTASSPLSYMLSMETVSHALVKPELEPMFAPKKVCATMCLTRAEPTTTSIVKKQKKDLSVQRLSKIARFRS